MAVPRVTLAVIVSLLILVLLLLGGARARQATLSWLSGQPEYVCNFREITLEPSPPPWIKSGRDGLLERVLSESKAPEWLPVLDLDLSGIERAFKLHSPWVERVERVERAYPNLLVVRLRYREPVAEAQWPGNRPPRIVVDREGVILPVDDLDWLAAGPLIWIMKVKPPADPLPGRFWGVGEASGELAQPDPKVAAAAQLAAFFKARQRQGHAIPPDWRIVAIDTDQAPALWTLTANETLIFWGDPPGCEPPGELTADQKWTLFREWVQNPASAPVKYPDFLEFAKRRVRRHSDGRPTGGVEREGSGA
jgi:hypothetical protein